MGYDIALARSVVQHISKELTGSEHAIEPVFLQYDWLPLLNAPRENDGDMILSTITIMEERESLFGILFSEEYHKTRQCMVVLEDATIETLAELSSRRAAAQKGTTGSGVADTYAAEVVEVAAAVEAFAKVQNGKADVAIMDLELARVELPDGMRIVEPTEGDLAALTEFYGIAVARSQWQLLDIVNAALRELGTSKLEKMMGAGK